MNQKQLARRQARWQVGLRELYQSLPDGLRRVFDTKGIPSEGTGKYSIPNERVRISKGKEG